MEQIIPHGLYDSTELQALLGRRNVERLRDHGLIALGDRYLGQNAINAFLCAAEAAWKTRVHEEGKQDEESKQSERMEKGHARRAVQRIPQSQGRMPLSDQLARSRGKAA